MTQAECPICGGSRRYPFYFEGEGVYRHEAQCPRNPKYAGPPMDETRYRSPSWFRHPFSCRCNACNYVDGHLDDLDDTGWWSRFV